MKELAHLKRLSAVKSNKGILFMTPAVSPGCHCPMRMAALTAGDVAGLSSLLVGMPECTTHVRLFNPKPEGKHGELHWLYVLDANEVVFGCRNGVMDALRQMDKAGAKAILLIATCVPELIGEDMEALVQEIQPELNAPVAQVMLGQFKNFSYPPGYWKTLEALGALMKPQQTNPLQINVLGRSPKEDHIPMPSLFSALESKGIGIRYLAPGAPLADFQCATDAALNLVISPFTEPLAARMERDFGVPYLSMHTSFSVRQVDEACAQIAQRLGLAWDGELEDERSKAVALEQRAKDQLTALRYISTLGVNLPLALALYLAEFGMEPLLLHMEEFYPEDKAHAKRLLDLGQNPPICRMVHGDSDLPILEALAPDICFGGLPPENTTIPKLDQMYKIYGRVGYDLTASLLTQIFAVLDKAGHFEKGAKNHGTASL